MLNTRVGGVIALRWGGGMVHDLPFMVFVLLQLDKGSSLVVVTMVVFVVVDLMGVMIWFVLTPLWRKWLDIWFYSFGTNPVPSRLLTHVLAFEFQVGDLRNVWLIDSGYSRHMIGDKAWFSSLAPVVSKTYITFGTMGEGVCFKKVISR
jgi:hypothetical protein